MAEILEFFVDPNPDAALFGRLSALDSTNPLFTQAYSRAMSSMGRKPLIIGFRESGKLVCGCPVFVSDGWLSRTLEIPSLPVCSEGFWNELLCYCRSQRITDLSVQTFASRKADIPPLSGQTGRTSRWEFLIDLTRSDVTSEFGKEHRRLARRAAERGMQVRRTTELSAVQAHLKVSQYSTDRRRSRGEDVGTDSERMITALLRSGCSEIFQAIESDQVMSSIVVMKAKQGAYLFAAGSTSDGMKLGASHFLICKTAEALQQEGCIVFNLGGVNSLESGLAAYKARFGAVTNPLQSAHFFVGSPLQRKLQATVNLLRSDRRQLKAKIFGRGNLWKVYSVRTSKLVRAETPIGVEVRKLSDEDILKSPMPEWLRQEQRERVERLGFNGAYGVFCGVSIAHVSWLIPSAGEQPRTLALCPNEAEISACFTLPEFRGRNLYPLAIAHIATEQKDTVQTLFMKTTLTNKSSQHGLVKAGLRPCGWVLEYDMPRWMGAGRVITIRAFRRPKVRPTPNAKALPNAELNQVVRGANVRP